LKNLDHQLQIIHLKLEEDDIYMSNIN
jgi:hypothetical protein